MGHSGCSINICGIKKQWATTSPIEWIWLYVTENHNANWLKQKGNWLSHKTGSLGIRQVPGIFDQCLNTVTEDSNSSIFLFCHLQHGLYFMDGFMIKDGCGICGPISRYDNIQKKKVNYPFLHFFLRNNKSFRSSHRLSSSILLARLVMCTFQSQS